jgi:hypothetical protein
MVAAATSVAAAFLLPSAGQTFAASCAGGSVDCTAPETAMCFGTMFPQLRPFHYSDQASADLAATMENATPDPAGTDRGTADDSARLPSEYTYLGQFIDHNLDFDETAQPSANVNASTLTNVESFRFDLNNVFGGGPAVDPQLYAADHRRLLVSGTLGTPQASRFPTVTGNGGVFDLARNPLNGQALLVEPGDDENQILCQIAAGFAAFHNDFVNHGMGYARARQLTEDYYQEIVLTDVLPSFVGQSTIDRYLHFEPGGEADVHTPNLPNVNFTPIEFSVGAYRFGHSLVRDNYHINDIFPPPGADIDNNVPIFNLSSFQFGDLSGGAPLAGPNGAATTTCTATSLCEVPSPAGAIAGCHDVASPVCNGTGDLISRDFARGKFDGMASGQAIARALGCPVIPAASINPTHDAVFNIGTPLIYNVLAMPSRPTRCSGASARASSPRRSSACYGTRRTRSCTRTSVPTRASSSSLPRHRSSASGIYS